MVELNVGVIGAGQMGANHIRTWEALPEARLVAVADPDEATARLRIGRAPVDWHGDWRELVARDDIEAVSVVSPSEMHCEVVLGALAAGKHVLVEKPIATTMPDALRMASAAREAGRKLMVGHVERFNPAVGKVQALLAEGVLGRVYRASAVRAGPTPARIKDAGVAIDLATHDLDIMQHLLGLDITHVYAEGTSFEHGSHEDMLSCLLRFGDDGPYGILDTNWLTPEKRRELTLIGELGMIRACYLTQEVYFVENDRPNTRWGDLARSRGEGEGAMVRFALPKTEPLRVELAAFAACVLEDGPVPVSAAEGARSLAAALAVQESASNGRPVDILSTPAAR